VVSHFFNRPLRYTGFGGKGKQVRDLLHPADLFSLIKKQLSGIAQCSGEVFNVGGGPEVSTSLLELTVLCQELLGHAVPITEEAQTSPVDIPLYISDCGEATRRFDWRPQHSVRDIVEDIRIWIAENETQLRTLFT